MYSFRRRVDRVVKLTLEFVPNGRLAAAFIRVE